VAQVTLHNLSKSYIDKKGSAVTEPLELYNQPVNLFVAGFIGSPPMNFFTGTLSAAGTGWEFVETNERGKPFVIPLPAKLSSAAQALRPERHR